MDLAQKPVSSQDYETVVHCERCGKEMAKCQEDFTFIPPNNPVFSETVITPNALFWRCDCGLEKLSEDLVAAIKDSIEHSLIRR